MADTTFDIEKRPTHVSWAEPWGNYVKLWKRYFSPGGKDQEVLLLEIDREMLYNLAAWAQPNAVNVAIRGPMAEEIRQAARELGLAPDVFALTAVRAFMEAGRSHH